MNTLHNQEHKYRNGRAFARTSTLIGIGLILVGIVGAAAILVQPSFLAALSFDVASLWPACLAIAAGISLTTIGFLLKAQFDTAENISEMLRYMCE